MMADISSVSQSELLDRRRQLRHQRRLRLLQTLWHLLALGGIAGGLIWGLSRSDWMLRHPGQITIEGNRVLSTATIRSVLPIRYPQSLLTLQPQSIAHQLELEAPIADATVTRRLFPPGLIVQIQERYPVAIVHFSSPQEVPAVSSSSSRSGQPAKAAFIDEEGAWIPYDVYVALNPSQQLPELKVFGLQEQHRSQWVNLYQQVSRSPIKISEIDWRSPANLILRTELGIVYLGTYSSRFADQLRVLDQLRNLPQQIDLDQIAYIDLRNPDAPLIEMIDSTTTTPETEAEHID